MSDSDETVCEDGEGTMSPSIMTAISRKNSLDHLPLDTENGSPEFLPPNAKVQKLGNENTGVVPKEPAKTCACDQDLQSLKPDSAFNAEKTAAERLKEIKKQEGKIEELLLVLKAQLKGEGASLKESPVFAQAKLLMTQVKTQLAEFTVYLQQQRQQIAQYSNESQDTHDGSESQQTFDIRQKILQLAAQQKELLACFQCHKRLLDKMRTLKKSTKANTKNTLPAIEKHISSRSTSTSFNIGVSNPSGVMAHNTRMLANKSRQDNKQSVNDCQPTPPTSTLKHAMLQNSSALSMESSSSASQTMLSDKRSQLQQAPLSCTSAATENNYSSSETQSQSLLTPLSMPQQRAQNVVLTAGQFFQVGDKQVYVLPQGLLSSVTSAAMTQVTQPQGLIATTVQSTAKTQGNHLPQITPSKASLHKTTAAVATKIAVAPANPLMTSVTKVQSSEGSSPSTLLLRQSSCKDQTTQSLHSQKSSGNALPFTGTIPLTNTFATCSPSTSIMSASSSSTLQQNKTVFQTSQLSNHGNKQITCPANSTTFSLVTNENNRPPQMLRSTRVQTPSHSCSGLQSTVQANKSITPFTSKATVVQSKSSRSLQRQNSFGSDLPDIKSLLGSNVIEAGSNVLSIQFEGRNFEASLRANGLIESAGGETFRTPMAWMRAVIGSWTTVKQSQAYKMVHYKGKPLALFTIPSMEKGCFPRHNNNNNYSKPCERNEPQNEGRAQDQQGKPSRHEKSGLITSWDDMAQLLTTCQVIPISSDEFIPTDSYLPVNFWDVSCEVDIPQCVLEELNF